MCVGVIDVLVRPVSLIVVLRFTGGCVGVVVFVCVGINNRNMALFDLQAFIKNPTIGQINKCRKDDLFAIAAHYKISVVRQALKKEIKHTVLQGLFELNVLLMSGDAVDEEADGETCSLGAELAQPSTSGDEQGVGEQAAAEAEEESDAKASLPQFEPFSPVSTGSRGDARLKVRLARLQLEAQEKAQVRHAELELRLEIRRLETSCGSSVLVQGLEMEIINVPLHRVHIESELVTGFVRVGVRHSLPVKGVTFILGNDLAGGKVMPLLEVLDKPDVFCEDDLSKTYPDVFPACVLTRAQSRKAGGVVNLADSFIAPIFAPEVPVTAVSEEQQQRVKSLGSDVKTDDLKLPVTREQIITLQKEDQSLAKCFDAVKSLGKSTIKERNAEYFVENELLMRKWWPITASDKEWDVVYQIVVPTPYRQQVLSLAHDHELSGHLGITKTYNRILRHFFWPGLKSDVAAFCRSCHTCQYVGQPNQVIPPAPLSPIPAIGEPFEHVIVDCVGPLPKTKSGNQFLLTMMCVSTRFPEAIPLRKITAPVVIKALIKFFSTFGLPKIVQTDQGTNFLSKLFSQVLKSLGISHNVSSAYHPESQGALERFHQTLKSMLRKYCFDSAKDWDEGIPLVLFAVRETVQESLGFSPAELVFGHTVRGPLKVLKENIMAIETSPKTNILDYVCKFRERLHTACSLAKKSLATAQKGMKRLFDEKAALRSFKPGDKVLVLLPVPGSALSARFTGPYEILKKVSDTNYVICTPDRKRQSRLCHVNMLKAYYERNTQDSVTENMTKPVVSPVAVVSPVESSAAADGADEDGIVLRNAPHQCARLANSVILKDLPSHFMHLTEVQRQDIVELIRAFPSLFNDIPTQTTVLQHDINVENAIPIKQHPYRVNITKRSVMKKEVEYLLENGLAKPSCSAWSSPCLLVPKPDGTFRFCTDYWKVNAVTVPDCYPLPRMEDCIDNLGSARFVSKLDLLKGYLPHVHPISPLS